MDGFYTDMAAKASHALALATVRGLAHDRAGLITLARQVLAQAKPLALEDPDSLLSEAQEIAEGWPCNTASTQDQVRDLSEEPIDRATLDHAVERLDNTTGPGTPGDAYDAAEEFTLILAGVLHALHLHLDVGSEEAVCELSNNRLTGVVVTVPPSHSVADDWEGNWAADPIEACNANTRPGFPDTEVPY